MSGLGVNVTCVRHVLVISIGCSVPNFGSKCSLNFIYLRSFVKIYFGVHTHLRASAVFYISFCKSDLLLTWYFLAIERLSILCLYLDLIVMR